MATNRRRGFSKRPAPISLPMQDLAIQSRFRGFRFRKDGQFGVWRGTFSPRPSSPAYFVEVRYRPGGIPRARVLRPALHPDAPHTYEEGDLCLFWPKEDPWNGEKLLATFIFPLIWSWLGLYELWLETGKWHGPESPHRRPSRMTEEDAA